MKTIFLILIPVLVACSNGGGSPGVSSNNTNNQTNDGDTPPASAPEVSNVCVSGNILPGCTYPAPTVYPKSSLIDHPFWCHGPVSGFPNEYYVSVAIGSGGICVLYSEIASLLQGSYASFGVDYFAHYPLILNDPLCTTQVQFEGQTVTACF